MKGDFTMKKSIITTTAAMIASFAMAAAVIAAPMQPLTGRGNTTTKECTLIGVAYEEGNLILNLADSNGNLYQYKETENFYFNSPVSCTVTLEGDTITSVNFE